jgi:arabinofuranosyltransferase
MRWFVPAVCAALQIGAMLRCYRRFIYDEPTGRVFGLADDVYISACFGRSLVSGHGFVWYAGAPRVEGITNPLWSALLGLLHLLPGFSADRLGAFTMGASALLLTLAAALFCRALARASGGAREPTPLGLLLVPGTVAVSYWSAEGFEIALLATLTFAMLYCACDAKERRAAYALGVLAALGLATRLDFALLATPAALVYLGRRPTLRHAGTALAIALSLAAAMLVARRVYFGDWLPNTYYLKTTGWPLADRFARGYAQNRELLWLLPIPFFGLLWPRLRHGAPHAFAAFAGFTLTVAYSTYVGGDAWRTFGSYDRHTAVGSMLLVWGLWALVGCFESRWLPSLVTLAVALPLAIFPIVRTAESPRVTEALFSETVPVRNLERDWIRYGKAFREISEPGARIAVCPAGAIIYFSERGGVDLLGKVDPYVARLPVSTRKPRYNACWRDAPGHNKCDDVAVFELRKPEYSRPGPPKPLAKAYTKIKRDGMIFHRRIASP